MKVKISKRRIAKAIPLIPFDTFKSVIFRHQIWLYFFIIISVNYVGRKQWYNHQNPNNQGGFRVWREKRENTLTLSMLLRRDHPLWFWTNGEFPLGWQSCPNRQFFWQYLLLSFLPLQFIFICYCNILLNESELIPIFLKCNNLKIIKIIKSIRDYGCFI